MKSNSEKEKCCHFYKNNHVMSECKEFLGLDISARFDKVKNLKLYKLSRLRILVG